MFIEVGDDPTEWPRQMLEDVRNVIVNLEQVVADARARLERKMTELQTVRDTEQRFAAIVEQFEQVAR